jgi:hypothetical protein
MQVEIANFLNHKLSRKVKTPREVASRLEHISSVAGISDFIRFLDESGIENKQELATAYRDTLLEHKCNVASTLNAKEVSGIVSKLMAAAEDSIKENTENTEEVLPSVEETASPEYKSARVAISDIKVNLDLVSNLLQDLNSRLADFDKTTVAQIQDVTDKQESMLIDFEDLEKSFERINPRKLEGKK